MQRYAFLLFYMNIIMIIIIILSVNISTTIKSIIAIKELEGIWQAKVSFEVTWFDQRLCMQNLKKNNNLNILKDSERKKLWTPEIIFREGVKNIQRGGGGTSKSRPKATKP